jgi:hypothetical protein
MMSESLNLDESEWDFSEKVLPDEEVRACLIWESGRESLHLDIARWAAELHSKTEPSRWDQAAQKRIANSSTARRKAMRQYNELAFDLEAHWSRLYRRHEAFNSFYSDVIQYASPWSKPWRLFPDEVKASAVARLNDPGIFPPLQTSSLGELEALWIENGKEIIEMRTGLVKPKYDDSLEMLSYEKSHPVEVARDQRDPEIKELTVAFTVNFSLYTNRQIVDAFAHWLIESRPCSEPVRRGRKLNDDRAALEGIGIMRALHWFPFSHELFPSKLKKRGRRACDKARLIALRRFHEVLPFVPSDSLPASWDKAKKAFK